MKLHLALAVVAAAFPVSAAATDFSAHHSVEAHALRQVREGRETFRYATFGDEAFWGDGLGLHLALAGADHGGVGPGVSPANALAAGLPLRDAGRRHRPL